MARIFGGVGAALLLAAGIFFWWRGADAADDPIPPPPATTPMVMAREPLDPPPEAPERSREEKRFDRYDKDRSGIMTREEYLAPRRKAWAKLDTNGDGRLSFEEWAVKTSGKFATADADRSGTLTRTEFATTRVKRSTSPRCASPPSRDEDQD